MISIIENRCCYLWFKFYVSDMKANRHRFAEAKYFGDVKFHPQQTEWKAKQVVLASFHAYICHSWQFQKHLTSGVTTSVNWLRFDRKE